jgi:succinate-acetate transporter protein
MPTVKQTKFFLTAFVLLVATVMAFLSLAMKWLGHEPFLDASGWWGIAGSILALYSGAHVVDTHLQQNKQIAPESQQT